MKKHTLSIIITVFFAGFITYTVRDIRADIAGNWRDAPADISFEKAGSMDAGAIRSYRNEDIPAEAEQFFVKGKATSGFYSEMLNACSKKFGEDNSFLKKSFLRIPAMTRGLFISDRSECEFDYNGAISDSNCAGIVRCVNAVVEREKIRLKTFNENTNKDDGDKLYIDFSHAVGTYKILSGKSVSYDDFQDDSLKRNWQRFLNSGTASFNPNDEENRRLSDSLNDAIKYGKLAQAELIHEALLAANGNVTMGMGSLAKVFFDNSGMVSHIQGMKEASEKNYYRFVGMYVGLHKTWMIRNMGSLAGYGNIAGNPVIYGTDRVCKDFWKATIFALEYYGLKNDTGARPVNFKKTLETFGPKDRGNLIDKVPEYGKGLRASMLYRKNAGLK